MQAPRGVWPQHPACDSYQGHLGDYLRRIDRKIPIERPRETEQGNRVFQQRVGIDLLLLAPVPEALQRNGIGDACVPLDYSTPRTSKHDSFVLQFGHLLAIDKIPPVRTVVGLQGIIQVAPEFLVMQIELPKRDRYDPNPEDSAPILLKLL